MNWDSNRELKYADITQTKYFVILEHLKYLAKREEKCWNFLGMQFAYLAGCSSTAFSTRSLSLISIAFFQTTYASVLSIHCKLNFELLLEKYMLLMLEGPFI